MRRTVRIVDRQDEVTGIPAMMRTTGGPTAIIARLLAVGDIDASGARRQELIVPGETMLAELGKRGVQIEVWEGPPSEPDRV